MKDITDITDRYSRQVAFAGIGQAGQAGIGRGRVLLVGCGALGTHIAGTLVRAGIRSLHIVDPDTVELSNLQRQTLFDEKDASSDASKARQAVEKLRAVNSAVALSYSIGKFSRETAGSFNPSDYDLIMDGTDDIVARFFINDYAVAHNLPWIYGAVAGSAGMAAFFPAGGNPCLNCIFDPPASKTDVDTAGTKGVIAPVVAMTTALQCNWALQFLSGRTPQPKLAHFDIWADQFSFSELVSAGEKCPCCGKKR